jgi:hypothetical protein
VSNFRSNQPKAPIEKMRLQEHCDLQLPPVKLGVIDPNKPEAVRPKDSNFAYAQFLTQHLAHPVPSILSFERVLLEKVLVEIAQNLQLMNRLQNISSGQFFRCANGAVLTQLDDPHLLKIEIPINENRVGAYVVRLEKKTISLIFQKKLSN